MKRYGLRYVASLVIVLALCGQALHRYTVRFIDSLDAMIYDAQVRLLMPRTVDSRIVILDIDEASLAQLGRWPWDRARIATLVERLFEQDGAAVLGFDIVFAEADDSSGLPLLNRLSRDELRGDPAFQRVMSGLSSVLDYDGRLARSLRGHAVVLGYYFANQASSSGAIPAPALPATAFGVHPMTLFDWSSHGGNLAPLQTAARRGGFFNPVIDFDGAVRRVPLVTEYQGGIYEALSLAVVRALWNDAALSPVFADADDPDSTLSAISLRSPRGPVSIPVDENGAALVPWRGVQRSFPYYSVADVLAGRIPEGALRGKIVLLGTTAPGLVDQRTTPVGEVYPGVEVHANLIAGMLDGTILSRPASSGALEAIALLVTGALMSFAWPWRMPGRATLLSALTALAVVGADIALWRYGSWVLPIASLLIAIGTLFVLNMSYAYFVESRAKRKFAKLFGQYVPPELVEEMSRNPESYSMTGRRAELTVLFCDVLGFTAIAEALEPEQLALLMNEYLGPMTAAIRRQRGTLDKYMGDAIMAFWGAPVDDSEHAHHAVTAALDMRAALVELNSTLEARGWPTLSIGIGINTGPMTVGDMGSTVRRAYTVLGDAVNVAARLEGLTRHYKVDVIVGEATRERVSGVVFREIDRVRVAGRNTPVALFEPLMSSEAWAHASDARRDELARWHAVLERYRLHDWDGAAALLEALIADHPQCGLYRFYQERIMALRESRVATDWDGITTFDTK
ncbi:CHASE2 domain-containing protein [Paraburkholderia sp. HP33-1]|uniref:CHASE2 domain-containing protein n=1 Tax=Paraburkholderia sp. HP33-1 TaxID=2883243 RepID=UPI001F272DA7|nr:adenylate/guanylate cyclase domain-containing protein [Paraburkholderia sp. HP33-1]